MINSAKELKQYRITNNISQQTMADRLGYANRSSIHLIETGKREFPDRMRMLINYLIADKKI
tara:strand:+ start:7826 stop:8011 length:186 start_codon:yes stop_codon:yes gene_type:complete